jgi:hypothetical protein
VFDLTTLQLINLTAEGLNKRGQTELHERSAINAPYVHTVGRSLNRYAEETGGTLVSVLDQLLPAPWTDEQLHIHNLFKDLM